MVKKGNLGQIKKWNSFKDLLNASDKGDTYELSTEDFNLTLKITRKVANLNKWGRGGERE